MRQRLRSDIETRLRLGGIWGNGVLRLAESLSGLLVLIAGYAFVARLFRGFTGVEAPVFFSWNWKAVPEPTTYDITTFNSGGHGTLRLGEVPVHIAALDALLLVAVAIAVFMVLRQIRGLLEDVEYRSQLTDALSYRLRRMGWFVIAAGGSWMLRDGLMSWWVSGNVRDPDVLDSVSFNPSVSALGFVGIGAGLLLLVVARFIVQVTESEFYGDAPAGSDGGGE